MIRKGFILLGAMSLVLFTSCKDDASKKVKSENVAQAAERDAQSKNFATMAFEKTEHDFGVINEGDQVETVVKFTNTGSIPLLITIAPGAEGQFTVKYNSTNKPNLKTNTVTVTANTEKGREIFRIKAFATPNPELEAKRQKAKVEREARMKAQQEAQLKAAESKKAAAAKTDGHNH